MISCVRPIPTKKKVENIKSDFKLFYHNEFFKKCSFYDGLEKALYRFKYKGHNLNLVTNKRLYPTEAILKHFKIYNLFSDVKGYDEYTKINKKKNIKKLLIEQPIRRCNTVYIGDTIEDFGACKQLDLPFIGVTWGYGAFKKSSDTVWISCCLKICESGRTETFTWLRSR